MTLKKLTAVLSAAAMIISLSACRDDYTKEGGQITTADVEKLKLSMETEMVEDELFPDEATEAAETTTETTTEATTATVDLILDREGTLIGVPASVNRIASGSERITQLLIELGLGGKIVAADKDSASVSGVSPSVCTLNKKLITASSLEEFAPDVVILEGQSTDKIPETLREAGVNVICIPEPTSIEAIKTDILFLAEYLSAADKGTQLAGEIDGAIATISARSESITAKRKVYFEAQSNPEMKGYADGELESEILALIGGINMLEGQSGIVAVAPESVVTANPNVIITSVSYEGYDVNEINTRVGWLDIKAVKSGSVRQVSEVSTTASIVDSIYEIAKAVYPEIYRDELLSETSASQAAPAVQASSSQAAPAV